MTPSKEWIKELVLLMMKWKWINKRACFTDDEMKMNERHTKWVKVIHKLQVGITEA